ncbi:cytochrome P450 [Nonomuraea thailandensis]|uniref:Cytochrome P450 n=1 Tax=Nonomuraea thailandensis TaxID=1188745 RepID=A0A9X2K8D6_9ACTN|nr:cytochrome P450 [Nonomuraea thailandensis]MCP2363535.1 cytochrome P450 [Nonomuraea thailandensis]
MSELMEPSGAPDPAVLSPVDVLGFDPFDRGFLHDPYSRYRELSARGALFRTRGGLLVATTHELCTTLLRDPRFGRGSGRQNGADPGQPVASFLWLDPPDHTRLRALVSRAFTPRMIERLRPRIEAINASLIRALPDEADLVSGLAYPLPVMVISEMLGVPPEDHDRFRGWSEKLARGLDPMLTEDLLSETGRARREFGDYFRELAALRRERPGDDLLSALTGVPELTEGELLATCVLLLVAGHETTVNLIANGVLALLRHGRLAQAALRPKEVVEEVLRYDPPVQLTHRVALEDVSLGGTPVPRGTPVMAVIGAANRDPAVFPDPDRFDVTRSPERHLAFGLGIHFCLGATLARMEGEIALSALAAAAPGLELAEPAPPYKENVVLRGLASLPVRLNRS